MTVRAYIERIRRLIYNGPPADDATITIGLVKNYLYDAVAAAAKANYKDNLTIESIGFVNDSFYTTYKGLAVLPDETFTWKVTLPEIPIGIGYNEGISTLSFKDSEGNISQPCVPVNTNQRSFSQGLRPIPNRVLFYYQGKYLYAISTIPLNQFTASITMISGGISTGLDAELNVPADYFPIMQQYLLQQLMVEFKQPTDVANDGLDTTITT